MRDGGEMNKKQLKLALEKRIQEAAQREAEWVKHREDLKCATMTMISTTHPEDVGECGNARISQKIKLCPNSVLIKNGACAEHAKNK